MRDAFSLPSLCLSTPGPRCGSNRRDHVLCEQTTVLDKGCLWPAAKGPGTALCGLALPPFCHLGVGTASQRFMFHSAYRSGSAMSQSFISSTRRPARQFEQNLVCSVLTLLPHHWQRSGVSSALGQVVSKHTYAQLWPLPQLIA